MSHLQLPGIDALDAFVLQDGEESVEAGSVLSSLRALTAELHPVLHQVQRLHEHRRTHPA